MDDAKHGYVEMELSLDNLDVWFPSLIPFQAFTVTNPLTRILL